ncbi:hypothetical protein TWF281_000653 [Arthrobotrys megalospora]
MGFKDITEFMLAVASRVGQDLKASRQMTVFDLDPPLNLPTQDRMLMTEARLKGKKYTQNGAMIGLCLGVGYAIFTIRRRGLAFRNLRAMQGSGATVRFADGREELITNIAPAVRPSFTRNAITFGALGVGGYMLGGIVGGSYAGKVSRELLEKHPDSVKRIRAWERRVVVKLIGTYYKHAEELDAEMSEKEGVDTSSNEENSRGLDSWPPPDNPPPEFPRSF